MKTPDHKPMRKGVGSTVRLSTGDLQALVAGSGGELRDRLQAALDEAMREQAAWRSHDEMSKPLNPRRLATRGWILASDHDDILELHMRHGDFQRVSTEQGGHGHVHGRPGTFGKGVNVIADAWQACLFSRRHSSYLLVGTPGGHEDTLTAGLAALAQNRAAFKARRCSLGDKLVTRYASPWTGQGDLSTSGSFVNESHLQTKMGKDAGTIRYEPFEVVQGLAHVLITEGYFGTTHNRQHLNIHAIWHMARQQIAERDLIGPFSTFASGWTLRLKGAPPSRILHDRWQRQATDEDVAFPIFETKSAAMAYARMLDGIGPNPPVDPKGIIPVPSLDETGMFAQAA